MKVLIIKVSALGDVVHALPVLAYLKSVDAEMQIDWLVEQAFAPFLEDHPLIDNLYTIDTRTWRKSGPLASVRGTFEIVKAIRKRKYDCVLDLQGNAKSGLFTLTSGAPLRAGFDRDATRESLNLLATNRKVSLGGMDFHITDRSLAIAKAMFPKGKNLRYAGPLPVYEEAALSVEKTLAMENLEDAKLVVLHYGTTWVTKHWPLVSWQALAKRLVEEQGLRPVLTWGDDKELVAVESIQQQCGDKAFIWPKGSLKELTALLARADLVVGGDTGPIHIAAAVGTPTVSIFRVTDPSRNAPRGEGHCHVVAEMDCTPCLRKECDRDQECGLSISVETVYDRVVSQLGQGEK
jgi:heptosyltransferase-1